MNDKEKQIREMAQEIRPILTNRVDIVFIPDLDKPIAEELIKQGYCKVHEDSVVNTPTIQTYSTHDNDLVVLSRKEYENYKKIVDGKAFMIENITDLNRLVQLPIECDGKLFYDIADFGNYIDDLARKETVKEILDRVDDESYGQSKQITDLLRKQYGVEVD